jgi:catalase-peroxidase
MKKLSYEAYAHTTVGRKSNRDWWPNQLNIRILYQNPTELKPTDKDFDYKTEFEKLDLNEIKEDLKNLMKRSQNWWPADYGHYGPLFIRMAWHSAGTYRVFDGRGGSAGGNQRFAPLNSWPDNANLDKARKLLWPIKKKYGNKISWADLMILAGDIALESMGFKTLGFAGGRVDIWESEEDAYWGKEGEWLGDDRHTNDGNLENPFGAVQMGLIYVNPEGPSGEPNILGAAKDIRVAFKRMGMNDEETVALIAGGHTFGKSHGVADPSKFLGSEPEAAPIQEQGLGWRNSYKSGKGADTITSGIEGSWTPTPVKWDNSFLKILFKYEWNLEKSPAGAWQWVAVNPDEKDLAPDAHDDSKKVKPIMLTTDLALKIDPVYNKISKKFLENPKEFKDAFAKAWFKLIHRDLGPKSRYLGTGYSKEDFDWQEALTISKPNLSTSDVESLKDAILSLNIDKKDFIYVAWRSAATFRITDKRGGANGARIRLKPQNMWQVNEPDRLDRVIKALMNIQDKFKNREIEVSIADLIILAGNTAIEEIIENSGYNIKVPFKPGRVDATNQQTYEAAYIEPIADAFVNYLNEDIDFPSDRLLLDQANLLNLTPPEMTVLIGGLRSMGVSYKNSNIGIFDQTGKLSNNFFVNLLDANIEWRETDNANIFQGVNRKNGDIARKATRVDLIFGYNSILKAQAEFYAQDDNREKFIRDFIKAWSKVMNSDRFDVNWY